MTSLGNFKMTEHPTAFNLNSLQNLSFCVVLNFKTLRVCQGSRASEAGQVSQPVQVKRPVQAVHTI